MRYSYSACNEAIQLPPDCAIRLFRSVWLFAWMALIISFTSSALAADRIVTIGTGSVTGVYYPAGGAICRLLNQQSKENGIRCLVEATDGSIYNLQALREGQIDFGIVQSDWQYGAYKGEGLFAADGAFDKLRSVFSLHSEMFTIVAAKKSGIRSLSQLKGKRVNIGDPGSGMRAIMEELMTKMGWSSHSFTQTAELKPMEAARALCHGKLDAMVFTAGHPNGLVQELTANCGAVLVPVEGNAVDRILAAQPYYARTAIPGGMYKGNPQNTTTFGVKATLVTTTDTDEAMVYQLTKAVFENINDFRTLHFVFATLDPARMTTAGLTAPLHPGALRYYREAGLLKEIPAAGSKPQ